VWWNSRFLSIGDVSRAYLACTRSNLQNSLNLQTPPSVSCLYPWLLCPLLNGPPPHTHTHTHSQGSSIWLERLPQLLWRADGTPAAAAAAGPAAAASVGDALGTWVNTLVVDRGVSFEVRGGQWEKGGGADVVD
jgi:hypothetical protein